MDSTRRRHRRRVMAEMNVVPYIDVMLVLLVIFMITAPLLAQGVKVDLPRADAQPVEAEDSEPLVVSVDAEGRMFLNYGDEQDAPIGPELLMTRVSALLRLRPDVPVLVRGDRNVAYGDVVSAMALLQSAGAPSVGLLTEMPDAPAQ